MTVRVQTEPFDPGALLSAFSAGRTQSGGIVSFTGLARLRLHGGDGRFGEAGIGVELEGGDGRVVGGLAGQPGEADDAAGLQAIGRKRRQQGAGVERLVCTLTAIV